MSANFTGLTGRRPVLAFDVGGTDIKSGVVASDGSVRGLKRTKTPHSSSSPGGAVVECLAELVRSYRQSWPSLGSGPIGVCVPGIVDEVTGTGVHSANLGWRNYPFVQILESKLGVPVAFGHDVVSAGEAELRLQDAGPGDNACFVAIGTGISGVIYADGRRICASGYAGELGQAPVQDTLAPYGWGVLEDVASAASITRRYNRLSGKRLTGSKDVLAAMTEDDDPDAAKVWDAAMHALALALAHCVTLLGTTTVVIGGGLSLAGDALLRPLHTQLSGRLHVHKTPDLLLAKFGGNAGLIGSALKASDLQTSLEGARGRA